jgi:hypothetical protein
MSLISLTQMALIILKRRAGLTKRSNGRQLTRRWFLPPANQNGDGPQLPAASTTVSQGTAGLQGWQWRKHPNASSAKSPLDFFM